MDYLEIGRRIRKYRRERGLSQEELAECVDISTTHMSHIETGSTKLSLPVLVGIAAALRCGSATCCAIGRLQDARGPWRRLRRRWRTAPRTRLGLSRRSFRRPGGL